MIINNSTDATESSLIANNMIAFGGYSNTGILLESVSGYDIVYNSVNAYSSGNASKSVAIGDFSNGDILNNLLANSADGYVIYANNTNITNGND